MDAHVNENTEQGKSCGGGEGDANLWIARTSENSDNQVNQCQVFKSGPLLISSKGIGWTSWKKRWFILTRTSLVFYRSDPNVAPQRGSEGNLTLGGIDLNNSGSVVVRADKKLLTVLFPDGRDGRAFTLKAETSEDLSEWKSALENALAQAPSAAFTMGHNGIFRNDVAESIECSLEQGKDRRPVKSTVVGRPVLLALEDIDGEPSFLEKALRFIEEHGVKVEGILRQSADVEEVERRVQEYEHGKIEFSPDEDAHVIGDCIKHVLRELPSSPVPASCCTALVEAYRSERGGRVNAIRTVISETFPDPNRRLLQRILKMMRTVASHKAENRMTLSALAACMAPLLLRPLLAGDCELENDFDMGGDGSMQLLQAAAAANHAQAIVIILLEEHERIFVSDYIQEGSFSSELYTESEADDGEDEDDDDDDETTDDEIPEDDGYHDAHNDLGPDTEGDPEYSSSEALDESSSVSGSHIHDIKDLEGQDSDPLTPKIIDDNEAKQNHSDIIQAPLVQQHTRQSLKFTTNTSLSQQDGIPKSNNFQSEANNTSVTCTNECCESLGDVSTYASQMTKSVSHILPSSVSRLTDKSDAPVSTTKRRAIWGRTSARKNLSMESIDYTSEDEIAIQRLEITKSDLQSKIAKEVKENEILQSSLERRKEALHERRVALEQDVERLKIQLQKERNLRACLETGVMNLEPGHWPILSSMDSKTRADLEEIALAEADVNNLKQKVAELHGQLNQQRQQNDGSLCELCREHQFQNRQSTQKDPQKDVDTKPTRQKSEKSYRNEKSGATCENMKSQTQGLSSQQNMQLPDKQQDESTHRNRSYSPSFSGCSSTEEPPSTGANAAFMKSFESVKTQSWGLSLHNKQPSQRQQSELASQNSTNSTASVSSSSNEEPSSSGPDAPPMMSFNNGENVLFGTSNDNVETQNQESALSPLYQPPQMQQTSMANMNSSKFSSSGTSLSTDESTTGGRNASSKKSSARTEEAISSSSSALARLTNRLNFLKERRSQLVNEFQNMGTGYTQGAEGPPRNTSR